MRARHTLGTLAGALLIAGFISLAPNPVGAETTPPITADAAGNVVRAEGPISADETTVPAPDPNQTIIPGPCPSCDIHNSRPGSGPGIWHTLHLCDTATGQGTIMATLGNNTTKPVPFSLTGDGKPPTLADGSPAPTVIPAATVIPATPTKPAKTVAGTVTVYFLDHDMNQAVVIAGTIGGRTKQPETFDCPCNVPTTTVASSIPSSSTPTIAGSTVTSVANTSVASVPAGRLPETGPTVDPGALLYGALVIFALAAFCSIVTRRGRHA